MLPVLKPAYVRHPSPISFPQNVSRCTLVSTTSSRSFIVIGSPQSYYWPLRIILTQRRPLYWHYNTLPFARANIRNSPVESLLRCLNLPGADSTTSQRTTYERVKDIPHVHYRFSITIVSTNRTDMPHHIAFVFSTLHV